ncbi:LysM peptidoglycan-binding domain-containing protein [Demequina activiva]|uniref:LysM domain-containing protein n=1 Tax=Demequina activiva TaxID=1582364 RepID=A0A919Q5M3_9MICO|nr:LysM peptidoglycan-binding domain-containing protein [Demequina activiva]GIG54708.1 hypothetical protein Dac01nite_14600 [Demequina activiva]
MRHISLSEEHAVGRPSATSRALRTSALAASAALTITTLGALPASADEQHRVQPGETVSALALRYDSSIGEIVRANGLDSRALIVIGQTLTIPSGASAVGSAPAGASASGTHTVATGDTVWDLARRYGTTVAAIVSANDLGSSAVIRVGQRLQVPGAAPSTVDSVAPGAASSTGTHTVAAGDTVWDLARRYGVSVSAIANANGLDSRAVIRVGQKLEIPGASAAGSATATSGGAASALATGDNLDQFAGATQSYTVVAGDTVSAIAARFGVSASTVVSANGLKNASLIRAGQTLTIPGGVPSGLVGDSFLGRTYAAPVVGAANQNKATLNGMDVPSRDQMQAMIIETARHYGVDPALAQAIAYQESGFNMRAVSPANAIGAMQVIPSTGEWVSELVGRELDLLDPQDNVTAGVALLAHLQRDGRALETAIAGYYQGEAGVRKYGMHADTRQYVASVLALMSRFG